MSSPVAKPTPEILAWSDYEIGVMIHYDIEVYDPEARKNWNALIDIGKWKPTALDTDQWVRTAKAGGARYALLTAKHGTGFCLWPTKVHDYHVGNTPVPRDVVGEFVASCRRYGIAPGLYYSTGGAYLRKLATDENGVYSQEKMNEMVLAQAEELITEYGPLCEMWFDGGILRPEKGGPDIPGLLSRIAPDMVCFGGCPGIKNVLRWSGSEQGVAVPECWSAAHFLTDPERNNVTSDSEGDPADPVWAPVECDMPNRDVMYAYMGGWMCHPDDADKTYSAEYLFSRYLTSVGRNANLLLGMVPDKRGLITEDQVDEMVKFGNLVNARFGVPLGQAFEMKGDAAEVWLEHPADISYAVIEEDQTDGQRILDWVLETRWPAYWCTKDGVDRWIPVAEGKSIGHKRIVDVGHLNGYAFRVRIRDSYDNARISAFRIYGRELKYKFHDDLRI